MLLFETKEQPLVIAGPCSAETREQVLQTAAALSQLPVKIFRAGIWKPRTKPGNFEGIGEEGLKWLQEVKRTYQFPVAIEVAQPQHIELALKYGIDAIWIGARTVVNPFQVQELASCLKGVQLPVMVKNPVTPDIDLWEGAIQRFEKMGLSQVAAIHRGFSSYNASSTYRNHPNWIIPIELKRRRPDLFIISDPSHITGKASLVKEAAQKAMNIGFNGLMIETHPHPKQAWSDAAQQITPNELQDLLASLIIRKQSTQDVLKSSELEYLRQLMDGIDAEIIDLLSRRMELSDRIGALKKDCNMTAFQPERWNEMLESLRERGAKQYLNKQFIATLFEQIHDESIRRQTEVMKLIDNPTKP
ncbi:MAG TPA: bifunctional 3-deoxy-7-phosphoheptulonate synthase/chorismate mutase type II [Flavipsychrobacter sp.]|nr:bifunctional 3-deoxy-7-phosphoheptulonate synthase/chorismate mutase type II [Flavipsychrobacter sp.]